MISTIDFYVTRTFLSGYLILMAVGLGLYLLGDSLVNIDEFTQDPNLSAGEVLTLIADFYGAQVPLFYSQLAGPVMAVAAAFALAVMLRNNELTALLAAGMPLQRLVAPLTIGAVVLVGVWVANREWVIPSLAHKIARTHDDVVGTRTEAIQCARDQHNAILSAARFLPREGRLERVYIVEPDASGRPRGLIAAEQADWDPQRRTWRLQRGRRIMQALATAGELGEAARDTPVAEYSFGLSPEELVLRRGAQWSNLMSLKELNSLLRQPNLVNRASLDMSRHLFVTQPLVQLILVLLTIPHFLTREPANIFAAGGRALLMAGAFFLTTFMVEGLARSDQHAALFTWAPLAVFGGLAVVRVANVKT